MSENFDLIDKLLEAVLQGEEWYRLCNENPRITEEEARLQDVMERISKPSGLFDELESAVNQLISAYTDTAILYGIHTAQTINAVAARQYEYFKYVADKGRVTA